VTVHLGPLLVEAEDPVVVTRFWEAALGEAACRRYLIIEPQRRAKVVKNRVHVDVYVRDVASLLVLGARVLEEYLPLGRVTLADVEGNEFCAFIDPGRPESEPAAEVFAVCTDSDRPEELAAWWAPLLGAEIGPGPDGTMRWLHGAGGRPELIWKFVRVHDERVVPNRWQWSVAAGRDELVNAGASDGGDDLLVDPDGNQVSAPGRMSSAG
jgi:glyoxalase superfamily protein